MVLAVAHAGFVGTVQNRSHASLSTTQTGPYYASLEHIAALSAIRPRYLPTSPGRGRTTTAHDRGAASRRWSADRIQSAGDEQRVCPEDGEGGPGRRSRHPDDQHAARP